VGRIPDGSSQPAVRVNGWIGTLIVGNVFRNAKVRAPEEQDWVTRAQTREGDITTTEVKAVAQAARSELSAVSTK
ncbi:hypothetical protein KKG41_01190, partial [Patescibacteria group bacterium]|nr:hypothetical protein [Patescibacteria group bacterium]MBU1890441.1 hypothetical protein [Patescibacteria group bacterium]